MYAIYLLAACLLRSGRSGGSRRENKGARRPSEWLGGGPEAAIRLTKTAVKVEVARR